jgi:hypothetical protein
MVLISSSKFTSRAITLVSIAASISNTVAGDADNLNPTGEGCVDPKGFLDCYADQQTKATECATNAPKTCSGDTLTECLAACGNSQLAGNVGCWVQSCWNQVSSSLMPGFLIREKVWDL